MIKLYNNIYNIKCVLATNFSADVNLYDEILSLTNNKIARLNLSYHQNHADINEFKSKLKYLANKHKDINFNVIVMLGYNRYSILEINNIFNDLIVNCNNIYFRFIPITYEDGTTYEVNNINLVENNNKFECLSFKYSGNRIKSCYSAYYNSIFTYDMIWYRCFQNKNYIPIDIKKVKNFYNLFNIMKTRPINCNFDLCCYKAELINRNMFD